MTLPEDEKAFCLALPQKRSSKDEPHQPTGAELSLVSLVLIPLAVLNLHDSPGVGLKVGD